MVLYSIPGKYKLYDTEESINSIVSSLKLEKEYITCVDLSMNTYKPAIFKLLCNVIHEIPKLNSVVLESIFDSLNFDEVMDILRMISEHFPKNLDVLELPSNAISCDFPEEFREFIEKSNFVSLSLYNCGLGENGFKRIIRALDNVRVKSRLRLLDMSRNRINILPEETGKIFSKFENLSEIRIRSNTIGEKSMENFLKTMQNTNLKYIDLSDNFLNKEGMNALAELWKRNRFENVYLQDIKLEDGDMCGMLRKVNEDIPKPLPGGIPSKIGDLVMDISCNDIGQDCIQELVKLALVYDIKKLILFENNYEDLTELKRVVSESQGVVIDDEDDLQKKVIDPQEIALETDLLEQLNKL